jgi:hypothetical protein
MLEHLEALIGIDVHRPKLDEGKNPVALADTLGDVKHRSWRVQANENGDAEKQRGQQEEGGNGDQKVEETFRPPARPVEAAVSMTAGVEAEVRAHRRKGVKAGGRERGDGPRE